MGHVETALKESIPSFSVSHWLLFFETASSVLHVCRDATSEKCAIFHHSMFEKKVVLVCVCFHLLKEWYPS